MCSRAQEHQDFSSGDAELVTLSDIAILGRVLHPRDFQPRDGSPALDYFKIRVDSVLKGRTDKEFRLSGDGGCVGEMYVDTSKVYIMLFEEREEWNEVMWMRDSTATMLDKVKSHL